MACTTGATGATDKTTQCWHAATGTSAWHAAARAKFASFFTTGTTSTGTTSAWLTSAWLTSGGVGLFAVAIAFFGVGFFIFFTADTEQQAQQQRGEQGVQ